MLRKSSIVFVFMLFALTAFSQEKTKIGISGNLQQSDFGISVPIWLGEKFMLSPAMEFKTAEDIGTEIGIMLAPRFYLSKNKVAPYYGLKAGVLIGLPSSELDGDNEETVDVIAGLAFGGEYFLSDNFSFGVELQGNLIKSDEHSSRVGNPGKTNFNTGTAVYATVYF